FGDGPAASGRAPPTQRGRRRSHPYAGDQAAGKSPAACRGLDRDQGGIALEPAARALGWAHRKLEQCADLARDSQVAEQIGPVGLEVQLKDRVWWIELAQIGTGLRASIENHDPARVLAQAELDWGAQHPLGCHA